MASKLKSFILYLMVNFLLFYLIVPVFAVTSVGSSSSYSVRTDTTTLDKKEQEAYYNKIIADITFSIAECRDELAKDNKDSGAILLAYSEVLILMDWLTRNFYVDEANSDSLDGATAYTLFDIPVNIQVDRSNAEAVTILNEVATLSTEIRNCDSFCSTYNWGNGEFYELSDALLTSISVDGTVLSDSSDSILDNVAWELPIRAILTNFVAGKIASVLIKNDDRLESLRSDTSTTASDMLIKICTTLSLDPTNTEDVKVLLTSNKDDLAPAIKLYNEIKLGLEVQRGIGLENFMFEGHTYVAYHLISNKQGTSFDEGVNQLVKTMWELTYASATSSGVPTKVTDMIDTFDSKSDILSLMSNCTIGNGRIITPSDGSSPELKNIGYVILSASCTYDPFVSRSCDDAYLSVIKSFLTAGDQDEEVQNLIKVLQVAANTKKPLYVTEGGKSEWKNATSLEAITMASYHWATLQDVLGIDQNVTKAFAVIKGKMSPSTVDASTWEYSNYGSVGGNSVGSVTEVTVDNPNAANTTVSSNTTGTSASSSSQDTSLTTVGSQELQGSSSQMSYPIMITSGRAENLFTQDSTGFPAAVGGLTSLIIHNAAVDAKDNSALQRADREMLFLNGLGDVVLADNTIVMPAIANPLMYNYEDAYAGREENEFIDLFNDPTATYLSYYPYTAAFMNHYPTASMGTSEHLEVSNDNDLNKFLILVNEGTLYAKRIKAVGEDAKLTATGGVVVSSIFGSSFSVGQDEAESLSVLQIAKGQGGFNWHNYSTGTFFASVAKSIIFSPVITTVQTVAKGWENNLMITRGSAISGDGIPFFPMNTSAYDVDDSYLKVAPPLTTSTMRYISDTKEVDGAKVSSGHFRIDTYITNCCAEAMLGTQYSETIDKAFQVSYEDLVKDSGNRFLRFLSQICDSAIEYLGRIDGVLAIKGPYSNQFFNVVVRFIQQFYLIIAAGLMIIVASKFMRGHYNMIYVCFLGALCVCGFEVYANWLPTAIPSIYNFAVNDAIEDIVWSTVMHQAEQYEETYKDSDRVDASTGTSKPYTATITLYQLSSAEMSSVVERVGVSESMLRSGTQIVLDNDAGIFIQGNQIKMSLDKLLVNNSMRGLYQSQWATLGSDTTGDSFIQSIDENFNDNPYSVQLTKPYVSLEAYYTPYDHIERAFMVNLNTFSNIFRIARNQYSYDNGRIYKDAFLVQSFVHSGIFTAPGDDDILMENIVSNSVLGGVQYTVEDIVGLCNTYFALKDETLKNDWLNIRSIFENPADSVKDSLWGQMMQNREWYRADWSMTPEGEKKISELISYVNSQTKLWITRNEAQLNYLSDENAVKMISLYATTAFTHFVSEIGDWYYPNYINASDIELQDVLYGSMTTLRDRNHAYDGTVVNTIALNLGVFGVVFLLLIVIFSTLFIFVVTYIVPILYGLFGAMLLFKLINDIDSVGLVKGYIKVTGVTAIFYFMFSLSLKLVRIGGYNWYGYLGSALLMFLCLYFLFWVILSVVQDVGELGNNSLQQNLLRGLDKITRGAASRLTVNTTNLYNNSRTHYTSAYGSQRFSRGYSIDDYDNPSGSRAGYYGYQSGRNYNEYSGYSRTDDLADDPGVHRRSPISSIFGRKGTRRRGWSRTTYNNPTDDI